MATIQTKTRETAVSTDHLLKLVLGELKSLRKEFAILIPQEDLAEYAHARRVKRSYEQALRTNPVQ